jgi:nucleoside-diphosphate-sugar epimerase
LLAKIEETHMNVCVIGGSGFIGSHLINSIATHHTVTNIDKQLPVFPNSNVTTIIADVREYESLKAAVPDNTDYIVLLAAEHRDDVSPVSLYYDVNVEGAHNVLKVMAEKHLEHIIFTSSVSVYGLNKKDPDELSGVDPFNHYGKSKLEAEKVLRRWFDNDRNGKSLIIVRPTVTFGPGNKGNVYNLLKQIASGKFVMVGRGKNKKSMAYVENVAGFISHCIDKKFKGYHLFNYIDKPDLATKELVHHAEEALGKKIIPIKIPYFIGYSGGIFLDMVSKITKKKFSISAVRVKKFCATTQFSSVTIQTTNYTPKKTLAEGLEITIKSIVENQ